jgi:hypothetical protein
MNCGPVVCKQTEPHYHEDWGELLDIMSLLGHSTWRAHVPSRMPSANGRLRCHVRTSVPVATHDLQRLQSAGEFDRF